MWKCNRSKTTKKNFGKNISTILGASPPQSLDIKEVAPDAQVVHQTFFVILSQTFAKKWLKIQKDI